jgi:DNA invertase Pin-like site-specific DNA recombinase
MENVMKIVDGRGLHKKEEAKRNRERIKQWFKDNPESTKKECCDALGISYLTLQRHLEAIG